MNQSAPPAKINILSPQQKLDQSLQLYWRARELKTTRIEQHYPELTNTEIEERVNIIFKHART